MTVPSQIPTVRNGGRREPKVVLSRTLVQEIRIVFGIAHPREPTVVLLWPKYVKRRRSRAERALLAAASFATLLATAMMFAHG
jgi:hypothetical protein